MSIQNLFQLIENTLNPSMDGWCTVDRANDLACQVIGFRPSQTVVVGVWGGRDTFALAMAHRYVAMGKVMAVDPWRAAASIVGQEGEDAAWWAEQEKHDLVYGRFMENIKRLQLEPWIDVRRATSNEVTPPPNIGILIIDGNHGPQAVTDVQRYAVNVNRGGIVYMDDIQWKGAHVVEAIQCLMDLGFRECFFRDNGSYFQRVK